ncbi:MAG: hypothetical protein KF861_09320 [Planctomycetaceae bacterium]|nr:hypothetical protein [Planctomycetaceae bacterium]
MKSHLITAILSAATAVGVTQATPQRIDELEVGRLIVRGELIVSDTGETWEKGFEEQMIPRGIFVRGGGPGQSGLWVRGRLIQCEIDDPFDTRFHSANTDGSLHRAPGHISWNSWIDGAWRQMALIQGEGLEYSEVPAHEWSGGNHPGRLRFQTFRPHHDEPLTDATIGQGKMSLGGGGYGGGGLPYPSRVLELWGGDLISRRVGSPDAPRIERTDGDAPHRYSIVAVSPQGERSLPSPDVQAKGRATLHWDSVAGADAYLILRDGQIIAGPLRIEGSQKSWTDSE